MTHKKKNVDTNPYNDIKRERRENKKIWALRKCDAL